MKISEFEEIVGGRAAAAKAFGVSVDHFGNWLYRGYTIERLENGEFILITSKTKITLAS